MVPSFKCLGRVLSMAYDDWMAVIQDLAKERIFWQKMSKILSREGARPRVPGIFFKAVVRSVLLFGAETWVLTFCKRLVLGFSNTWWRG